MTRIEMILSLTEEEREAYFTGPWAEWCPDENCWMPIDEAKAYAEAAAISKLERLDRTRRNYGDRLKYIDILNAYLAIPKSLLEV